MEETTPGILLYYKYVDLTGEQTAVKQWMQTLCEDLGLRGRIRVAQDGINTTVHPFCYWLEDIQFLFTDCRLGPHRCASAQVGGSMAALRAHIDAVHQHHLLGSDIDFKLASSPGPSSTQAARETGFQSLTVSICQVSSPATMDLLSPIWCENLGEGMQNLDSDVSGWIIVQAGGCGAWRRTSFKPARAGEDHCAPRLPTALP